MLFITHCHVYVSITIDIRKKVKFIVILMNRLFFWGVSFEKKRYGLSF